MIVYTIEEVYFDYNDNPHYRTIEVSKILMSAYAFISKKIADGHIEIDKVDNEKSENGQIECVRFIQEGMMGQVDVFRITKFELL